MKTYGTKFIVSVVAFLAVVGGIFGFVLRKAPADIVTTPIENPVTAPVTGRYKDGTYSATGTYKSPAGPESVNVSLTLRDGVVTDSTVVGTATNDKSINYQGLFVGGYKVLVVGRSINTLQLGAVSGSSLTPIGFNDALAKIKVNAQI